MSALAIQFDHIQHQAIETSLAEPVSVITGGPGRGKTTIIREIIRRTLVDAPSAVVLLAAPTGRAARRMSELTGHPAKTIHRLLEYHPLEGFRRNHVNPLERGLLIVDECSMIDLPLMAALLDAVPVGMRVVFVGDADQLPPVGPGAPFQELIRAGQIPVVRLERVYRQDAGSVIPRNAALINAGRAPAPEQGNPSYQHRLYRRGAREAMAADALRVVERLLTEERSPGVLFRPDDIQVLVPMRRGPLGVESLNPRLRDLLNPCGRDQGVFQTGGREFWVGDRVMHLVNNYDKGVFNGEIGTVLRVEDVAAVDPLTKKARYMPGMIVGYDDGAEVREVPYTAADAAEVDLAYACTIHKSQGGEFPAAVMALGWDAFILLRRNLVYTGLTRARDRVVLLTEEGTLEQAVQTPGAEDRHSALAERMAAV